MEREVGEDQATGATSSDDYEARENLWDEAWPGSDSQERVHPDEETDNLDEELPFPDVVGTRDPIEATRDAEPYMPPTDSPVLPGGTESVHTGVGFGTSALEETERGGPFHDDADLQDEALLLLRQDSLTSRHNLIPHAVRGVITLRGIVSDIDDAEHAMSIVGEIEGVVDVVDEMTIDPNVDFRST
ncbi:MAG TPA: BON domain-containing protein [Chloroflexota bacterium]|nr:BON domain-containing protein [Chloroflexota bacterium]